MGTERRGRAARQGPLLCLSMALAFVVLVVVRGSEFLRFLKYEQRPILVEEPFESRVSRFDFVGPRDTPTVIERRFRAAGFQWVSRTGEPTLTGLHLWYTDTGRPCLFDDERGRSQWNPAGEAVEHEWYNPQTGESGPVKPWGGELPLAPWVKRGQSFEEWWSGESPG